MTDDTKQPTVDARHAQGSQVNFGDGNTQINMFADPPLEQDLRELDRLPTHAAYELFESRRTERQLQLLMDSSTAVEIFKRFYRGCGMDKSFRLLRRLPVRRICDLLVGLERSEQGAIMDRIARKLASHKNLVDVRAHLTSWAEAAPERAAELVARVRALRPEEATRTGLRGAVELMPDGPSFLNILPPDVGGLLLTYLLPASTSAVQGPPSASASDIDLLLGQMVALDPASTAQLVAELQPKHLAWYLRRLQRQHAALLLANLSATAPISQVEHVLHSLPKFVRQAVLAAAGEVHLEPMTNQERRRSPSGWPLIDSVLTLASYAGPAISRTIGRRENFATVARREAQDMRDLWVAALCTTKDADYFRRQRNHLAALATALIIALILALTLA